LAKARILYLTTELDPGGAEKALYELVRRLDRRRFTPEVSCLAGRGVVGRWLKADRVPVHYLAAGPATWPLALLRLHRLMRRGRFDLVHTFLFHANVFGRVAARLAGVRRVVSSVRVEEPRGHHQALNALTWRLADRIVCVSQSTAEFFAARAHAHPTRLAVIPNGVDTTRFAPGRPSAGVPLVLSVGRLDRQKGYDVLIEAVRRCKDAGTPMRVAIAGDGPDRAALQKQISSRGLTGTVELLGRRDDVPDLLASAHLFVSASRWEGMPNAVLEAMAAGLPVGATAAGGTRELVVHGATGILAPPGNAESLAQAMALVLGDAALGRRMGALARERVEQHFTWEHTAQQHEALYRELL